MPNMHKCMFTPSLADLILYGSIFRDRNCKNILQNIKQDSEYLPKQAKYKEKCFWDFTQYEIKIVLL